MSVKLNIFFLAAEAEPFIKIGGLGDIAGSLPAALRTLAEVTPEIELDIRLAIPFHGAIHRYDYDLHSAAVFNVPHSNGAIRAEAFYIEYKGAPVYLIAGAPIPPGAPVYSADASLDGSKFTFFSLAALELARTLNWIPHVVHANDWHTAPSVYALSLYRKPGSFFFKTTTLLGLHNLPYLGIGAGLALPGYGLPNAYGSTLPVWAQDLPLPLGLLGADQIVAVSPGYAREILTPEFGAGLHVFLRKRAQTITGILNGLDTRYWNPATDAELSANYQLDTLERRGTNKLALQHELNLPLGPDLPLIGMVTRLDSQKGIDLLPSALRSLIDLPWQAVLLGSGDPVLQDALQRLEVEFPQRVRSIVRYDAALSHRIYAGADLLVIPSRYEPCGLTQMIAMRYGCVPVGSAVGGLLDTILDYDDKIDSTGFLFPGPSSQALASKLRRAFDVFRDLDAWDGLQHRGMLQDFSWEQSARHYLDVYRDMVTRRNLVTQSKGIKR